MYTNFQFLSDYKIFHININNNDIKIELRTTKLKYGTWRQEINISINGIQIRKKMVPADLYIYIDERSFSVQRKASVALIFSCII